MQDKFVNERSGAEGTTEVLETGEPEDKARYAGWLYEADERPEPCDHGTGGGDRGVESDRVSKIEPVLRDFIGENPGYRGGDDEEIASVLDPAGTHLDFDPDPAEVAEAMTRIGQPGMPEGESLLPSMVAAPLDGAP